MSWFDSIVPFTVITHLCSLDIYICCIPTHFAIRLPGIGALEIIFFKRTTRYFLAMATQDSGPIVLTPGVVLGKTEPVIGGEMSSWPENPADVPMAMWDSGVFITELINLHLSPKKIQITNLGEREQEDIGANPEALLAIVQMPPPIKEGTYRGTQLALTKMYELVETK